MLLALQELLNVTDGWAAYPRSIRRMFREKARSLARQGRCRLLAWPGLLIGTGIKRTERKRVAEVVRRMAASVWRNEPSSFSPRPRVSTLTGSSHFLVNLRKIHECLVRYLQIKRHVSAVGAGERTQPCRT